MTLEGRGVYVAVIIKKRRYLLKGVPCDDIDHNFHNRDISDVYILEDKTEETKKVVVGMLSPDKQKKTRMLIMVLVSLIKEEKYSIPWLDMIE